MIITFKDVGLGDSIIIEWLDDNNNCKLGVIDCCLYKHSNPVLEHIRRHRINEISFLIISHAHEDHYSGLEELLQYCINSNTIIHNFYHPFRDNLLISILNGDKKSYSKKSKLQSLIRTIYEVCNNTIIKNPVSPITKNTKGLTLNKVTFLEFISPHHDDFLKVVKAQSKNYSRGDSVDYNWIASIIKIFSKDWYILLTSDATKKHFSRLKEEQKEIDLNKLLILNQIPHHGSKHNHFVKFWQLLKKGDGCPSIVSVGENKKYRLPDSEVIESFINLGYEVFSTNYVNGLRDYFETTQTLEKENISSLLDLISTTSDEPKSNPKDNNLKYNGDKIFKLDITKNRFVFIDNQSSLKS